MENKKIETIVRIAKIYITKGYTYVDAIKLAEQEVAAKEIAKYEK